MSKFCKNCGTQLGDNIKFCASCGTAVAAAVPTPQSTAQPVSKAADPAAKKRGLPPKKVLIPVIAGVLVLALGIGLLPRLLSGGKYPFEKGATVEAKVKSGKDTKIGNAEKTGWEFTVPDGVMEKGTAVTMKVLSAEEAKKYQTDDFSFYGTPIEVQGDGAHGIWFAEPVPVSVKIPKQYLKDIAAEELFFATYENGTWHYFLPDRINLQDSTAVFNASHFSFLGFGKPSEAEQIKTFAQNYAANKYDKAYKKEKLHIAVGAQLDELFKSIGVESASARNQLVMDAVSYLESAAYDNLLDEDNPVKDFAPVDTLMRMAVALDSGAEGKDEFNDKATELFAKSIAFGIEKSVNANKAFFGVKDAQTGYVDKTAKAIAVFGGLGTAAGAFAGGDNKAGLEAVGNLLLGFAGPKAQLIASTLNYAKDRMAEAADTVQAYWTQAEIEEAYRLYTTPGGSFQGDFDGIFALKGNAEALMNIRIIKAHCAKYGINEDDLGSAARESAIRGAWQGLRSYFDQRRVAEPEIARLRQNEESFIAELKEQGLFAYYQHQKYFGIDKRGSNYDVATRLQRLYAVRDAVLSCIDPDKRADLDNTRLVRAIGMWIHCTENNDRAGFFKYLRETGLYEEAFIIEPTFAWVLKATVLTNAVEVENKTTSISNGSGSYSVTSPTSGDYFAVSFNWTAPGSVYKAGAIVEITQSVKIDSYIWNGKNDGYIHLGLNYMSGSIGSVIDEYGVNFGAVTRQAIYLVDEDGKSTPAVKTDNGKIVVGSASSKVSAAFPSGRKEGDLISLQVSCSQTGMVSYDYEWKEID